MSTTSHVSATNIKYSPRIDVRLQRLLPHIPLLFFGSIFVFPFFWMMGSSFKTLGEFYTQGLNPFPAGEWQFQNFADAWTGAHFELYFYNTLFITFWTTLLTILFCSISAFALSRLNLPFAKYVIGILGVIMFLPSGYTVIPLFEIIKSLKLLNTLWAVVVANVGGGMAFNTFLIYGYMRTIPRELEEAAIIDGASVLTRYWKIIMPLSSPMLGSLALFVSIGSWNSFFLPLIFTLGRDDLRTLAVGLYNFVGQHSTQWPLMAAGASIAIVPVIVLYIFLQRYFIEAFSGALKG